MILKTRHFARWARKSGLADSLLDEAVFEIERGLLEADLGGGIVKKAHCFTRERQTRQYKNVTGDEPQ
ncbi:MAG: type II toxin-antitoxin system RelE/ParE family toxin [bacterium]